MDHPEQNRLNPNNPRNINYSRQIFEMEQEKRKKISRNDRAERLNQDFNTYIGVINHYIGDIDNAQIQEKFSARLQRVSERYPGMFTAAKERYPRLFGGQEGEDQNISALGRSELVEWIRKNDNPGRLESLVRKGGTWGRDKDEIRVRQAIAEIKDLCDDLLLQREKDNLQAANRRLNQEVLQARHLFSVVENAKERRDWARKFRDRHQAILTEQEKTNNGVQDRRRADDSLKQLEDGINEAKVYLKSGIGIPGEISIKLNNSIVSLHSGFLPLRLGIGAENAQKPLAEHEILFRQKLAGYSHWTEDHTHWDESLLPLRGRITAANADRESRLEAAGQQDSLLEFVLQREFLESRSTSTNTEISPRQEFSDKGLNTNWVIPGVLAVGGEFETEDISKLQDMGIKHVVDTRAEKCDDKAALADKNIEFLHLPVADRCALSLQQLREGTDWINERLVKGESVTIHCKYGMGRSVMLAIAVLMTWGEEVPNALSQVHQKRRQATLTTEQVRQLSEFAEQLKSSEVYQQLQAERKELQWELNKSETRRRMLPLSESADSEGMFYLVQDNSYDTIATNNKEKKFFSYESYNNLKISKSSINDVLGQEPFSPAELLLTFRLSQTKGPQPCGRRPHRVKFDNQKPKEVYSFERH